MSLINSVGSARFSAAIVHARQPNELLGVFVGIGLHEIDPSRWLDLARMELVLGWADMSRPTPLDPLTRNVGQFEIGTTKWLAIDLHLDPMGAGIIATGGDGPDGMLT